MRNGYDRIVADPYTQDEEINIETMWKTPGWGCGKFVLPDPEQVLKLARFVVEIRKREVRLIEMIRDEIADNDRDRGILKEAIDQLKWQLNPENIVETDLPPIGNKEVADLALLASYFYEIFHQIRIRFFDIIEHSRKKWNPTMTKTRKFYSFRSSVEELKKEMDAYLENLNLTLDGRNLIKKCKQANSTNK
ncbi:hypothetical protein FO519_005686 [Halicephalobus sp. NKZ332]|nr:hypothetical protein FO519_005686 [Halicephalobus sp. NKZ332]